MKGGLNQKFNIFEEKNFDQNPEKKVHLDDNNSEQEKEIDDDEDLFK